MAPKFGTGLRAYALVRRSSGNPDLHIVRDRAFAVCTPHIPEYLAVVLKPAQPSMEASLRLVANRPDIEAELRRIEGEGKGPGTCVVCSDGMRWKPSGRPVSIADLADADTEARA